MFTSQTLQKIIRLGVYAALLTPLVYIPQVIFPTVFGKTIYFQTIIGLVLPFYLYLILFYKEFRPKFKGLTAIIFLFLGALFLSSLLGADWQRSFWGYDERMRGIFSLLHFLFLYLFIIVAFRAEKDRKKLLLFFIGIGVLAALFGVAERINPALAINGISVKGPVAQRVMSTTGNSIFFAGYMLFVLFLSLYYFLVYKDYTRWVALGGFLLGALNVLYTGTRGAFLGLVAGIMVYLIFLFFLSGKKYKLIFGAAAIVIIGFLALAFVADIKVLKVNRFWDFDRLFNISLADGSVSGRLLLWKLSLRASAEHPVLGQGLENFNYAFNKYYDPQFLRNGVAETFADRAHNLFLDWLVMAGVLGLGLYLAVWFFIVKKIFKKENFSKQNLCLLGLIAAFSAHSFFAVDDPAQNLMVFFFLAVSSLLFWPEEKEIVDRNVFLPVPRSLGVVGFLCFYVFTFLCLYFYSIKPLADGAAYINFLHAENIEDKKRLAEEFLISKSPYAGSFRMRFANQAFFDAGTKIDPVYVSWAMDKAVEEMKKVLISHPGDFSYYHTLGNLYLRKGAAAKDKKNLDESAKYYKKALDFSPGRQSTMFQLSTVYLLEDNAPEAVRILEQAVANDDKAGQSYWRLGVALLAQGKREEAHQSFKKSVSMLFVEKIDSEMRQAAALCADFRDYACVTEIYKGMVGLEPDNADNFAQLAAAYAATGQYEKAKEAVIKAVELDPSLEAEAKIFLKQIGY